MNTTVDFVYRFLRAKFNTFSRFLFDDQVRSRLVSDISWFEQNADACGHLFPYPRAEKFVQEMKRFGADGASPLDRFRVLITEIGNALGFVRMVRSGGNRFLNRAIGFVYDESEGLKFAEFAAEVQLNEATVAATDKLDAVVGKLKELFTRNESFFRLLVDVFAGAFRDRTHVHLANFYAIVPALTLCYLDHIQQLKDNALKQNRNASFSDDGFALGLAYVLRLLDQDALFDQLHWFESLKRHSAQEREELAAKGKKRDKWAGGGDSRQTVKLATQMIEARLREYELLETTTHSARILFN